MYEPCEYWCGLYGSGPKHKIHCFSSCCVVEGFIILVLFCVIRTESGDHTWRHSEEEVQSV